MVIAASSHRARINGHIKDAQEAAGYPGITKRKRVTTETGRVFNVESTGEVYLVQGSDEFLLSPEEVPAATLDRTLVVQIPRTLFRMTFGRFFVASEESLDIDETDLNRNDKESLKTIDTSENGEVKVEKVFVGKKAGARRRK